MARRNVQKPSGPAASTGRAPGASLPSTELDESAGHLVRKAHQSFTRVLETRLRAHSITVSTWFFLRALWVEDGKSQKELSNELGLTQATTVSAVDNMEQRGFVKRKRDKQDRRKTNIFLTPEGRALKDKLTPYASEINTIATRSLSDDEAKQLNAWLLLVIDALRQENDAAAAA